MNMSQGRQPTCIMTIGSFWIIVGAFVCLFGVEILWGSVIVPEVVGRGPRLWAPFQIAVGGLAVFTATRFLKMRSWARLVLEILSWTWVLCIPGYAGYVIWFMYGSRAPVERSGALLALAIGTAGIILLLFGVPFVLVLLHLRSKAVRQAFGDCRGDGAPARLGDEGHSQSANQGA